jgi:hypothetical protein
MTIGQILRLEIEHTFQIVPQKSTGHELWFLCPECNDKVGHRSVNLQTGMTYCFRCNKGAHNRGSFIAWAKALGYSFSANPLESTLSLETLLQFDAPTKGLPPVLPVALPRGFTSIEQEPNCAYARLIKKMAERKNLLIEDFIEDGTGFTRDDPLWEPFCIFLVKELGIPVYYQGRTYVDEPGKSTKLFPSRDKVQYGAAYWVYNIDALSQPGVTTAIVVESVLNVMSLRWKLRELGWAEVAPVCVFKHAISRWQIQKLLNHPNLREICLFFDADAIAQTWRNVGGMANSKRITIAEMPVLGNNQKADPNDDVEVAIKAFEQRKVARVSASTFASLNQSASKIAGQRIVIRKL